MATTSSFFRAPNKAEPQWLHDDDLFAQFIDADPLSLCNTSSGEANFTRATLGESSSVSELAGSFSADEDEDEDGGVELLGMYNIQCAQTRSCIWLFWPHCRSAKACHES